MPMMRSRSSCSLNSGSSATRLMLAWIFLNETRTAIRHFELPVDVAQFKRETVERGIRAGAKHDRMFWGRAVQFSAGGVALLAQAGDEDLLHHDPFTLLEPFGPSTNVL